ncbi:MAG: GIY-YIG nuclease family protein [Alphaproteobacteria bacterium]|jgi:putative endonuclease|nr:GIY-YIG nuclease family protein [Alphaproteobacteria bacterium]
MTYFVYMMASGQNGTLYTGVTNNLLRRAYEHREGITGGFTHRYGVKHLVWFEEAAEPSAAIQREKNIKHWSRAWKISLVEEKNPNWRDLFDDISG